MRRRWQENEDVREIYSILQKFSEMTLKEPFLADIIPTLARLPPYLQWWRKTALVAQERQTNVWTKYWSTIKEQVRQGTAPDCFAKA